MRVLVAKVATLTLAAAGIFATTAPASAGEHESESAHTNKSAADDRAHSHKTWHVSPGPGTISEAVAAAAPGDTLALKEGTFIDSVTIDKTLTIRGKGWSKTVIIKPTAPSASPCSFEPGSVAGLCVVGALAPGTTDPVENVKISRLRLTGFSNGVMALNAKGLKVKDVRADDNSEYGLAAFGSTHTNFSDNWVSGSGDAGLYLGDSPNANSVIEGNKANDNGIGIFMRDSSRITAKDNKSSGNCIGILALSTDAPPPGEPLAGNFRIKDNKVSANNKACPAHGPAPAFSGIGIALAGVDGVVVRDNKVSNHDGDPAFSPFPKGGIVVFSTVGPEGGTNPTNNTVTKNKVKNNKPFDISWDGTGTGNKVSKNKCETASPSNLGWCSE